MNPLVLRITPVMLISAFGLADAVQADCGIESRKVAILADDFEALHVVADATEERDDPTVTITRNQTAEHADLQGPALTANPATCNVVMIANDPISSLLNAGPLRPLDDLVARYGTYLQKSQLIRVDGRVIATALVVSSRHPWLRTDILDKAGLAQPKTYENVLAAAQAIHDRGIMDEPPATSYKPGRELAADFVNMYTGFGGELFTTSRDDLVIESEQGVKALAMMTSLSAFMGPDLVTFSTTEMSARWRDGRAAIENGWGSRAAQAIDPVETSPEIPGATVFASAPTVGGGARPATAMWWEGFALARNISDEDAEAPFRAMVHGIGPETAAKHQASAAWLIKGYQQTPAAAGVVASLEAGAKPYPMVPIMGILHRALGDDPAEFMPRRQSAETALADAAGAYRTAASEEGFLK